MLTTRVGQAEGDLTELVSASSGALGAIADQDPNVQRAGEPAARARSSRRRRRSSATARLGAVMGPAFDELRPFARNLDELNGSTRELAEAATPVLEDEIRPFVRSARKPIPDLRTGGRPARDRDAAA